MKRSVREAFIPWTTQYEGRVPWMYCDVKGLVSTGIGNLIDTIAEAARLPWLKPDGTRASYQEIADEWSLIKNFPNAARLGHKAVEHVAKLRMTNEQIDKLVMSKVLEMEDYLIHERHDGGFPAFDQWPADAQLATLSMAWACGPAFRFPKLAAALRDWDFETAALECKMVEKDNPGVAPRHKADKELYLNAARVMALKLDPEVIYWPRDLVKESNIAHAATEVPPKTPEEQGQPIVHASPLYDEHGNLLPDATPPLPRLYDIDDDEDKT